MRAVAEVSIRLQAREIFNTHSRLSSGGDRDHSGHDDSDKEVEGLHLDC